LEKFWLSAHVDQEEIEALSQLAERVIFQAHQENQE
jgi:hypothetical protein